MKHFKLFGALFTVLLLFVAGVMNAGPPDTSIDQNDQFAVNILTGVDTLAVQINPCCDLTLTTCTFSEVDYVPPNEEGAPGKDLIITAIIGEALYTEYLEVPVNYNDESEDGNGTIT